MIEIASGKVVSLASGHQPNFTVGTDASKTSTPGIGDIHVATDTGKVYTCFVNGAWNLASMNSGTMLDGIVPTFTNWSVVPGTNADMVAEEYGRPITTPGTSLAGAKITYDMGAIYRVMGYTDNQHPDMITWGSQDNLTWRQCTLDHVGSFAGRYRYIEIRNGAHVGVEYIKTLIYRI